MASHTSARRTHRVSTTADALAAFRRGAVSDAQAIARDVLVRDQSDALAHQVAGIAAYHLGQYETAEADLKACVSLQPNEPEAICNLGAVLRALNRHDEAEAAYRRVLAVDGDYVPALNNLGNLLRAVGRSSEAEAAYRATLTADREHADAWNALGQIAQNRGDLDDAEDAFLNATRAQPAHHEAWNNLGLCRMALDRLDDAQAALLKATELKPDYGAAYGNLGALLLKAGHVMAAEEWSRKAIALEPDQPRWLSNLATALQAQCRWDEAESHFRKSLALVPDYVTGHSNLLFCLNYRPDLSAEAIFAEYRSWEGAHGKPKSSPGHINDPSPSRRLRIGYVSPDFRRHAAAFFIEPLLASHDRGAVEVFCYAQVPNPDAVTAKLQSLADHWRSTVGLDDAAMAQLIRDDGIDVLVDLGGHTASSRLLVFTHRPAPVQIAHFLGHGYTSALSCIDAFIGDAQLLPQGAESLFAERELVRLDRIPLAYAAPEGLRHGIDLPAQRRGHVTFGYFGRTERLNDDVVAAWAAILRRVSGARLVLNNRSFTEASFRALSAGRFAQHGIAAERLDLVYTSPQPKTWEAYGEIDIALDPFPHNAGTTTIEALWAGVPVLSLAARPSVGRFGASILGSVGLSDWVASDVAHYVDKAVAAAHDLGGLADLRANLRTTFEASPLCDAPGLVRELEAAYRKLWLARCGTGGNETAELHRLFGTDDLAAAATLAETILRNRDDAEAHEVLGLIAYRRGHHEAAIASLQRAIALKPDAASYSNLGAILRAAGRSAEAEQAYREALTRNTHAIDARNNLTNLLAAAQRWPEAEALLRETASLHPEVAAVHVRLGDILQSRSADADAATAYGKAVALTPNDTAQRFKLATVLNRMGQLGGAVEQIRALLQHDPDHVDGWTALSDLLRCAGKIDEAEEAARTALARDPNAAAAANNLGNALAVQGRLAEAEDAFARAIEIDPSRAEAYSNRALSLLRRGQAIAAEGDLRQALALRPDMVELNVNLAATLEDQGRLAEAEAAFRATLAARPDMARGHGSLLFCLNYRIDLSGEAIFAEFRNWDAAHARKHLPTNPTYDNDRDTTRRLRIGYVSPDFKHKSAAFFTEPLLAAHDPEAVEIFCYAEVTRPDALTERFRALADHWRSTVGLSDDDVADLIRNDRIDILVDMGGHTADNRLLALARKPAPIQIAYLVGHGYTSGLTAMDVFLADDALVPPDSDALFAERVVRLDRIPLAYQPDANMPEIAPLPALACGHVTFGHFGRTVRINEDVIATWSEILNRVPGSRLVLNHIPFLEPAMRELYEKRFAAHGIAPDRLDLVYIAPQPRTWDAYAGIDIALDPFPHNAGTTTIEALWLGVPVVSLADRASVGRFGASILGSLKLDDWVANTRQDYVAKAVAAAGDLAGLAALRADLRRRFLASPMADAPGLARAMETTYRNLWRDWVRGPVTLDDAIACFHKGDLAQCLSICERILAAEPRNADALHLKGLVFYSHGDHRQADCAVAAALAINPAVAEWHANHAAILRRLGRLEDSANAAESALRLNPHSAEAHNTLANTNKELGRHGDAEMHFRRAVALKPDYADAWSNLSGLLSTGGHAREAEACARRAIALAPDNANSHNHLGAALLLQERLSDASDAFSTAVALKPDFALAHSNLLFCLNYRTDKSPEDIFAEYQRWDTAHARPLHAQQVAWQGDRTPGRKLRVGYFSPDFRYHAVSFFVEPWLAAHDRDAVELFLYAEVAAPDAVTERFRGLADHWRSTVGLSDEEVTALIRRDRIDVLVDLAGHSASNRLRVFARKPAPIQVTHPVGHGYTTGLTSIDAVLGDAAIMPEGYELLFSENVERLGRIPLVYAPPPGMPEPSRLPALSRGHVTFGCFSRIARINDGVIAAWAQILNRVPGSRLVLNSKPFQEDGTRTAFLSRFGAHGVSSDRLDLIYTSPQPRTWDAYAGIDIALDPFPHNAGTTTIEALWLGVPVVSLADRPSVGRFGASILGSVGMSDWVATDPPAYVNRAVAAAGDLPALADLRAGLRARFEASPLRDAPGLARETERAYRRLWTQFCATPQV